MAACLSDHHPVSFTNDEMSSLKVEASVVSSRCIRIWLDHIRPHHLVIFIVNDKAVPDVTFLLKTVA
jgi:hypothetical protein